MKKILKEVYRKIIKIPYIGKKIKKKYQKLKKTKVDAVALHNLKAEIKVLNTSHSLLLEKYGKSAAPLIKLFHDVLETKEIEELVKYYDSLSPNPKEANDFLFYVEKLFLGDPLTIPVMDAKLPDIISKITSSDIERATLHLKGTNDINPLKIGQYIDRRIDYVLSNVVFKRRDKRLKKHTSAMYALRNFQDIFGEETEKFFLVDLTLRYYMIDGVIPSTIVLGIYDIPYQGLEDISEALIESRQFTLKHYTKHHYIFEHTNGIILELFEFQLIDKMIKHISERLTLTNTPFTLSSIDIEDIRLSIPSNYDLYLSEFIGNWRDDIIYFDFDYDSLNSQPNLTTSALNYFGNRLKTSIKSGIRKSFVCGNTLFKNYFDIDFGEYYPPIADGDIMDNKGLRYQLAFFDHKTFTTDFQVQLKKLVHYVSGRNIFMDIVLLSSPTQKDTLKHNLIALDFIENIFELDSCNLDTLEIEKYESCVLFDTTCQEAIKNHSITSTNKIKCYRCINTLGRNNNSEKIS